MPAESWRGAGFMVDAIQEGCLARLGNGGLSPRRIAPAFGVTPSHVRRADARSYRTGYNNGERRSARCSGRRRGDELARAPDIVLGFYPGYLPVPAMGGLVAKESLVEDVEDYPVEKYPGMVWRGDHMFDAATVPGVFLSNFKIENASPRLIDICPTVLRCFNIAPPQDTDGQALF